MTIFSRVQPEMEVVRLIPDRTVRNVQSRAFATALHDLHAPWWKRVRIGKEGVHYRSIPPFWYLLRLEAEEASFYAATEAGEPMRYLAHRLGRLWPKATLERCAWLGIPCESTEIREFGLERHNLFSLAIKASEDTEPLGTLLALTDEMREGDVVVFAACFEPYDRVVWNDRVENAHREWARGKLPRRMSLRDGWNPTGLLESLNALLYDVHETVLGGGASRDTAREKDRKRNEPPKKSAALTETQLEDDTRSKKTQAPFRGFLRASVTCADAARRQVLLRSAVNAFAGLAGDNRLVARKSPARALDEMNRLRMHPLSKASLNVSLYSAAEAGKFIQLPTAGLQEAYADLLHINRVSEVAVPNCFLDDSGIYVGTATDRGKTLDVFIPFDPKQPDTTMTSRGFVGSPRQGKDQALINLIVESKRKHGIGAVVLDWIDEHGRDEHGNQRGMSDAIRDALEPEDLIDLQFANYDWPIFFGPQMALAATKNSRIAADKISKELSDFLMGDETDMHQTYEYLRDAAKVCVGDLMDIKAMFASREFAEAKMSDMPQTGIGDEDLWATYWTKMSDAQRSSVFSPVNLRLAQILNDEALKPIFCQRPNPKLRYEEWVRDGKVILMRMKIGESAKTLAHFATMTVFLLKIASDGAGAPTWLVINEPHQIQTKGFVKFMKRILVEGPKYRLAPVVAFHHLGRGHLWPEFADTLSAANISWHAFYNSNLQTYEKLRVHLEPTFTPDSAMKQTKRFHYIAASWRDASGETQPAFLCAAPRPVAERHPTRDQNALSERHSREFGRPILEVLDEFRARQRTMAQSR
ncbi:MAG: hypothetical protein OWS03_02805 [Alicyclobacillaceae bacterium]|nr:hypothetical protein [Alicyclobacillaceae bacterium]